MTYKIANLKMAKKDKIKTREEIREISSKLKEEGKTLVTANGCFDLIHFGHIHFFEQAKSQGDILIVGLNSDKSVKSYKGPERPILSEYQRAEVVAALECVDYVVILGDEPDISCDLVELVKPNVHCNGSEYGENCIEASLVKKYRGRIHLITPEYSTSNIIKKIKNLGEESNVESDKITKVPKVWGHEIWMANTDSYCGKELILKKGKRCSLHEHKDKDETFYIQKGRILMEVGKEIKVMVKGDSVRISPGTKHRFSGLDDAIIIEISTHHEDSDSYRVEGQLSGDVPEEIMKKYSQK